MITTPIATMFDGISPKYDQLNHLLSLNIDKVWRRKVANEVAKRQPKNILDLATGTADLAIALAKLNPQAHIIGIDFSEKMLEIGKSKIAQKGLERQIELQWGDATSIPFNDNSFDAITVAFGVRNFEFLETGLFEICRVLKPNGTLFVLEFSLPEKFPVKQAYQLYFNHLVPKIGKWISKDESAYSYLPQSVEQFPKPDVFRTILTTFNLHHCKAEPLTFGIAILYSAEKME